MPLFLERVLTGREPGVPSARPPAPTTPRLHFLDGLRGIALILMVINHTARWWMDVSMGWGRYYLAYASMTLPAPLFLFLVGFCLPISFRRQGERPAFFAAIPRYLRRGVELVLANMLLNLLVFPEDPVWTGGVLQTIGLSIRIVAPLMWVAHHRWVQYGVLALAVALYVSFAWAVPVLIEWAPRHRLISDVLFRDFPPWPWIAAALIGLVFGWWWLDARQRGDAPEARYFKAAALAGVGCILAVFIWDWWMETSPRVSFKRDFLLNHHWTPRGVTNLWIAGGVADLLALTYWVMEVKKRTFGWLVVLGQTAFMLYFLHQLIVLTLVKKALGTQFNDWLLYVAMNLLLTIVLVYLGKAWLDIKRRVRLGPAHLVRRFASARRSAAGHGPGRSR